ncbi:protein phosphatase 2C and cyclic nucleotide-binding/kinase domain-containing protein isoform X1 [Carex littledalei]|uniref:protein-serine/threonine phosphatase n=1 Tax=Carex littledalei TaxID=544730 RepID=A0A833VBZ6_9POAL|nr:protein phosphatase 2C and cyclic nucleotide-binding/kinase domain-containing protein isoform X1 [Carex littledalei]
MGCINSKCCFGDSPLSSKQSHPKSKKLKFGTDSSITSVSSDEAGEEEDQLPQQSLARDSTIGITRLSRISSQFLPPEGSRKVRVPIGNYDLRYSYLSQRGYYPEALDKPNQDSYAIHTPFGASPDDHFFGVFDGHGEYGAECSQFVKTKLCENLLRNSRFQVDAVGALNAAYLATNSQLHADTTIDDSMSGTTAITVLVRGRTLYVANAGDSRAVIAEKRDDDLVAVDLSIDQTPFRTDELERVKECGARVLTMDQIEGLKNPDVQCWGTEEGDDGDPPRLWVQHGMYPGTAFSRSIGDSVAESIGVIAEPEIFVVELNPSHPFFVVASDGVFEFISSQTVVDMVAKFKDPRDACAAIVAESYRLWLQYETRTDDITIIVVHVNGLSDIELVQTIAKSPLKSMPQTVEVTGSESPMVNWASKNNRVRQDISRARLRALENSLDKGQVWVPPSPSHRKTWEEEAHIERALDGHFLFRKLTDSQRQVLLDCLHRIEVNPGEIVVQQGGEGDCFYVVGSGEFEVFAIQEENGKEITKVLHQYTAEKLSSFGELALMYNKPLQASVRAVTKGTLWALRREDFRGILMSEFSNLASLKLLRSVEIFSRLTILQLSQIADSLEEVSFSDGEEIISKNDFLSSLYIVRKGQVSLRYNPGLMSPDACGILDSNLKRWNHSQEKNGEILVSIPEGGHFGEWALLGDCVNSLTAVSIGSVVCSVINKEIFDEIAGPVSSFQQEEIKESDSLVENNSTKVNDAVPFGKKVQFSDLEWKTCLCVTDCSEIGLVGIKGSDKVRSLKRFSRKKIKELGKEPQVLKEKNLIKNLSETSCTPQILSTCIDQFYLGILLDCHLACSLGSILYTPLDESCARFYAASVVVALEELHQRSILYRGITPDILMLDRAGRLQLVDFRFAKRLEGERTYTICGIADSLSPEIVLGRGHGFGADWWALGVLLYYMLQAEMPFGSWRQSELDTLAKIAKGQFVLPSTFSIEAVDLITKLLEVDENTRLGSKGVDSVKSHVWFDGLDWKAMANATAPIPLEITSRIESYVQIHGEEVKASVSSPARDLENLDFPDWIEDW